MQHGLPVCLSASAATTRQATPIILKPHRGCRHAGRCRLCRVAANGEIIFVCSPKQASTLRLRTFGFPYLVLVSSALPDKTVICIAANAIASATDPLPRFDLADQTTYVDARRPGTDINTRNAADCRSADEKSCGKPTVQLAHGFRDVVVPCEPLPAAYTEHSYLVT